MDFVDLFESIEPDSSGRLFGSWCMCLEPTREVKVGVSNGTTSWQRHCAA